MNHAVGYHWQHLLLHCLIGMELNTLSIVKSVIATARSLCLSPSFPLIVQSLISKIEDAALPNREFLLIHNFKYSIIFM